MHGANSPPPALPTRDSGIAPAPAIDHHGSGFHELTDSSTDTAAMPFRRLVAHRRMREMADRFGTFLVDGFHLLALFAIGAATVWSAVVAFFGMVDAGHATIRDILLLFIYLELGAMVGIYFKTYHMPVRYLIYVAITALTRLMVDVAGVEHKPDLSILFIAGAILILAAAALVLRYASFRFPAASGEDEPDYSVGEAEASASRRS
jgi:phosphate starvation-inducible membrane PsiE